MEDLERLQSILEQIADRNINDITEEEKSYCMNRGWAIPILINDESKLSLTQRGKDVLQAVQRENSESREPGDERN